MATVVEGEQDLADPRRRVGQYVFKHDLAPGQPASAVVARSRGPTSRTLPIASGTALPD